VTSHARHDINKSSSFDASHITVIDAKGRSCGFACGGAKIFGRGIA